MTDFDPSSILMVGIGTSAPMYYRVMLPAVELGVDHIGVQGYPDLGLRRVTGLARSAEGSGRMPDFSSYKLVVLQQPSGDGWLALIRDLQAQGVKVLYEVDDYLDGVHAVPHHRNARYYEPSGLDLWHRCMRQCDGMIVSTPNLASLYDGMNENIYVCRNGIDVGRYAWTKPEHEGLNVGWAGSTGHERAAIPWLRALAQLMAGRTNINLITIGEPLSRDFHEHFRGRVLTLPYLSIESYPCAMAQFDVALGPANTALIGGDDWSRAKSDLRWLESSMVGAAFVGNPDVYSDMIAGVTGVEATKPGDAMDAVRHFSEHVDDARAMGERAMGDVLSRRLVASSAQAWARVFREVLGE